MSMITFPSCGYSQTQEEGFRGFAYMGGEVDNPVEHFAYLWRLDSEDRFKSLKVDINGDGTDDYLFVNSEEYNEDQETWQPSTWDVYLSKANGKFLCVKMVGGIALIPSNFYVGPISELGNKRGVVSIRIDNPREGDPKAFILATTLEADGSFKEQVLAEYPAEQENAIFDKYLSEQNRTKVALEEKQPQ